MRTGLSSHPVIDENHEQALIMNMKNSYDDNGYKTGVNEDIVFPFVEAGISLSDYYCDKFFRIANASARRRKFTRNVTNDVGGAISTILGIVKAGSGVTGGVGAGFSFADSSFRNYDESFMVDADLSRLRRLVLTAQDHMKRSLYTQKPQSYFQAESAIIRYAGLCSFLGMQDLLNESVDQKITLIESDNPPTESTPSIEGRNPESSDKQLTDKSTQAGANQSIAPQAPPVPQ